MHTRIPSRRHHSFGWYHVATLLIGRNLSWQALFTFHFRSPRSTSGPLVPLTRTALKAIHLQRWQEWKPCLTSASCELNCPFFSKNGRGVLKWHWMGEKGNLSLFSTSCKLLAPNHTKRNLFFVVFIACVWVFHQNKFFTLYFLWCMS